MKHRIFTLFLALIACVGTLSAWDYERVLIGNLYYNLNASQLTAEVVSNNIGQSPDNINITIPSSVEYESVIYNVIGITGCAFYACSVMNIEIPNSITYIGGQAFAFCQGLTSIEIPSSVTNIGGQAFESDHSLTQIIVATDNLNYCSIDGVVFTKDTTTLIFYPAGKQGDYAIPNGVINIQSMAFWDCGLLTGVTIPNSVTSIGERAFNACNSLTSIDIPNSVISIGSGALTGCSSLTAINIAANNQLYSSVDGVLFNKNKTILMQYPRGKTGNYTIPNSVTSIGGYAFGHCDGLTSVDIPNNVISIDISAFDGCGNLTSVTIGDGVTSIGTKAFAYCTSLTSVTIGNSVTSIGNNAFQSCYSLPSVSIPNNVTSIGGSAFQYCYGLTSVEIPNSVTSIGEAPFQECLNLTSITVAADNPNYISEEGVLFDKDKDTLIQYPLGNTRKSYIIPNTITRIGDFVFYGCNSLTSVTISNSVTSIGRHAFSCRNLTSLICEAVNPPTLGGSFDHQDKSICKLYVPEESVDLYKAANVWKDFENIIGINSQGSGVYSGTCGDNLTWLVNTQDSTLTIEGSGEMTSNPWYEYRSYIKYVSLPSGLTNIGEQAFVDCTTLTSVTIPNSVTSIGNSAFRGCTGLTSIEIPNSVTSIGEWAFDACYGLISFAVAEDNQNYSSTDGVLFDKNKTILIQYPAGKIGPYTIPNTVTNIGDQAFNACKLTSIIIPNSVTSIGVGAFYACHGLTSVEIPNSVTNIGANAFCECLGLTSVTIPNSVTSIGDDAFNYCLRLTSVSIPNSVISIGGAAFYNCFSLASIEIPNSVTSIGNHAFLGCANMTYIVVAENNPNYSSADGVLFDKEKSILIKYPAKKADKFYTIPYTVTAIEARAFDGCTFTFIEIPNSVTSIGRCAFSNCHSLTSVICEAINPPTMGNSVFFDVNMSIPLYVPEESISAYQAADQWNEFANILPIENFFNPDDPQNPGSYRLTLIAEPANMGSVTGDGLYAQGTEVEISATPNMGHHFVNWSDDNTSATRTVTLLRDTAFTANFAVNYYDVTFKDYNGIILQRTQEAYGTLPLYNGNIPVRQDSALYTFTFKGWSPVIDTVREAAIYTAVYDSIYQGLDSVVVTNNKDIAELSAGTLTHLIIEQNGHLIVSEPRHIHSLTLHMGSTAAQVTNIANLTADNVEMVLHIPENADSVQWYAFAVPFEVAVANGIQRNEANVPAKSSMHFVIDKYDGALRASEQDGWLRLAATDTLFPGNLYMIAAYETPETWRFIAAHPESIAERTSINVSAYPSAAGNHHAGWNAISNTLWTNASASLNGVEYITTYNNQYGVYEVELVAGHTFLPAEPFFVQTPANGSILFSQYSAPAHIAPLQMALTSVETAVYTLGLTAVQSGYTDKAYITLNESKEDAYIIGRDLEKMQRRSSSVPQLWIDAYNLHLAAQEVAFTDSMASVALGLYVPVAGIYMLNIQDVPENTNVYLTLDGNVLSKLSLNTVELNLAKGENNRYGLYICNRSNTPEGIDDSSFIQEDGITKVLLNGQILILRGDKTYTLQGQEVK